jgi:hypothetical protein
LEQRATTLAQNPPFFSKGSDDEKRVASLCAELVHLFLLAFNRPLDEVVATIATVVTGQDVSTDSVKMRRGRWRKHYERGPK